MNGPRPGAEPEGVLVGRNGVREALERGDGRVEKVFVQQGAHGSGVDAIRRLAREAGVPAQVVPGQKLDRLAPGTSHQGVVAVLAATAYADLDEMLTGIAPDLDAVRAERPLVVALDEIEDPHNFGAILRSAVAAGARGVVVPERHMAPLGATALKASAGTALRIPVARVGNLAESLHAMKERGYWVVGLEGAMRPDEPPQAGGPQAGGPQAGGPQAGGPQAGGPQAGGPERTTVWAYDWARAVVLVVGNEGRGLRPRVRQQCDALAAIPMPGPAESLNASVAAGVALFAAVRARAGA